MDTPDFTLASEIIMTDTGTITIRHAVRAAVIIGPNLARALREETGFDVTGHPDFMVWDDTPQIEIRPGTIERMREAAQAPAERMSTGHALGQQP